jgi:hypothetical protein
MVRRKHVEHGSRWIEYQRYELVERSHVFLYLLTLCRRPPRSKTAR